MVRTRPTLVMLGGPNGAGKTTLSRALIEDAHGIGEFVNADTIAAGLSAFSPESAAFEAGRVMLKRIHDLGAENRSFAFESTLSSRSFAPLARKLKNQGYRIALYYVALPSAQLAVQRVQYRVGQGGHHIPAVDVTRRFYRSLRNLFELYLPIADEWVVFDNRKRLRPDIIAEHKFSRQKIFRSSAWQSLQSLAQRAT